MSSDVDTMPTIGVIGLGIMGRPMGRNLMKAGYAKPCARAGLRST